MSGQEQPDAAVQVEQLLRQAATHLPADAPLDRFHLYMKSGELGPALDELRWSATKYALPFSFWSDVSRAAGLLGME